MITGCLQQKNGFYYAVLYLKIDGRRRCKWIPMKLSVQDTSQRKAQKAFDEIRLQYEREEEDRLEREAKAKELAKNTHPDALLPFTEYMEKWLQSTRTSLATATYQSYSNMIRARILPYFTPLELQLREVTPQHIEDFYQSILADGCTTNTVIHYHAIIRKALQTAVKKDILLKNPADKVDRPKKNVFHGSFYSEEEMLTLFDAVSGDPLELCVKIAAYPDTMTKEQFYKAAHISKATALFLLQSGLVACKASGKQTRRYTIKTNDVIAYLQDRILYPRKYAAPDGWYVGRSGHGKRKSPGEFSMLTTLTEAQCEKLKAYFMSEMSDLDDVLSVAQLADFLGYAPATVVYWCNHNQVKHFDISGKYMIPKICIVEFLASQKSRSIRRKSYRHRLFLADFQNKYITA